MSDKPAESPNPTPQSPRRTQALTLLSGILEETQSEAEAERKRIEEQLRQREVEARAKEEAEEQRRREDAARRLAEEEARQKAAAERRATTMQLLKIEELKEKGLYQEPAPLPPREEVAAPAVNHYNTQQVIAVHKKASSRGAFLGAAVALLAAGGGVFAYVNLTRQFVDAQTSYAKAAPETVAVAAPTVRAEFAAPPAPVVEAAPEEAARPAARRPAAGTRTPSRGAGSTAPPPRIRLGGALGGGR